MLFSTSNKKISVSTYPWHGLVACVEDSSQLGNQLPPASKSGVEMVRTCGGE